MSSWNDHRTHTHSKMRSQMAETGESARARLRVGQKNWQGYIRNTRVQVQAPNIECFVETHYSIYQTERKNVCTHITWCSGGDGDGGLDFVGQTLNRSYCVIDHTAIRRACMCVKRAIAFLIVNPLLWSLSQEGSKEKKTHTVQISCVRVCPPFAN